MSISPEVPELVIEPGQIVDPVELQVEFPLQGQADQRNEWRKRLPERSN